MFWGPRSNGGAGLVFIPICTISACKLSRSIYVFTSVHLCWQCLLLKTLYYIILKATQKTYPKYTYSSRDFCLCTSPSIEKHAVIVLQAIQTIVTQITRQSVSAPNWLRRPNKLKLTTRIDFQLRRESLALLIWRLPTHFRWDTPEVFPLHRKSNKP
jgi:hypothetical protein